VKICPAAIASAILALSFTTVAAQPQKPDPAKLITPAFLSEMREILGAEIVEISVKSQNARFKELNQGQIDELDNQWKAEREAADKPLIAATLSNPLSVYLARIQGKSLGKYAEIFVMDQNGLNVGQSSVTSDFWQGDEGKFQKTFDIATDALFVDEAEWDEEAKIWRNQVSFTLVDSANKKIGAATVELNLSELERLGQAGL